MSIIMQYIDRFHDMLDKHADTRTTDWLLMSSPFPTLFICISYVYVVKVLGPKLMENRKPFQLKNTLIAYNLFQVIFSAWLFYEIGISGWLTGDYSLRCQPVDYSDSPEVLRMVHASWWYYFSKFTEFMDTIFFVLRKKNNHVSTLHVIHHGCMPMSVWFGVKFTPGGHSTFFGLLNTFVHIVMYTYYLLAAMGPKIQPYLWWKKYLTAFQMIQFIAIMVHAFQLLFIDCNYPKAFVWWIGLHAVMFLFLFKEFYQQSYQEKKPRKSKAAVANGVIANGNQSNGKHANGIANGVTNGIANGVANGIANGSIANGVANGSSPRRRDAADYYVNGESLATELSLRKSFANVE
ncbi:elongation of very long chain fatty acids protein AAEL008004-like isoform X1 [Cataglyphis hispanica]|uniref:elongation of very long chain fatty acids protein AAEL008004-like isoform X1 n=1 Tax=Cataglyphis hispanica TaxID=1086592 RepID=UPI00217FD4BA|nr:elongation of very long chain fatty acids protein AAEL008004-like isoform X1 [Cataglyphis hispanica]XP_050452870.1 elongation of very long chain fatty acids protein AAEL008004-like isoform X1 [Cataglyphis hispanica]XP_050452871.1 elongation of very long chain fatty acids protein AAEL008004-like isoform X1 [Cataglyphis hispanica]XP_050452873.1 elongation of very long chain fatty acids protein AAEL008004-like isoform X1 [Cataglyphis hispanica]XP_050452874.1 elongation of very long chain fatty 